MIRSIAFLTAMLAALVLCMRLSGQSGSYIVATMSGFIAGGLFVGACLKLPDRLQLRSNLWIVGISVAVVTIANQVWPSPYPDALGWSFFGGMVLGFAALAVFWLVRLSKTDERTR